MRNEIDLNPDETPIPGLPAGFDKQAFTEKFLNRHPGVDRNQVEAALDVAAAAVSPGFSEEDLALGVEKLLSLG